MGIVSMTRSQHLFLRLIHSAVLGRCGCEEIVWILILNPNYYIHCVLYGKPNYNHAVRVKYNTNRYCFSHT